ncbi:MAG: putative selenate reductase subunit YgfK [Candidatus Zixiibacteriota bacterium]
MPKDDIMTPLDIKSLFSLILKDLSKGFIFEIPSELFYLPEDKEPFLMEKFGQYLGNPIGVAAGPQTQMAQNIISAWLCGARYIELKTVQILDDIDVSKPCIDMQDVGYNCEWSQELSLEQSFDEYLKAWIIIHVLHDMLDMKGHVGTIFNMSVGYDLKGIKSDPVSNFIDKMLDAEKHIEKAKKQITELYPPAKEVKIPSKISDNITVSTMHGCPPYEIERIGKYLIEERGIHTTIKLNPTLLGPEMLREILNKIHDYKIQVPALAFEHDLKFDDALQLIANLNSAAALKNIDFALKLTNTLEVRNIREMFSKDNDMMYMSGRALHPLSVNIALRLQEEFAGELDISFCGGADAFNIADLLKCNLGPITVSSDLLKPGGYGRMLQYLEEIAIELQDFKSLEDMINQTAGDPVADLNQNALSNLKDYAESLLENQRYSLEEPEPNIKADNRLGFFDCLSAPCRSNCPTAQDIPQYMHLAEKDDFDMAFNVIMRTNPFPNTTGLVCDHPCTQKCTRINYDLPLQIREMKHFITREADRSSNPMPADKVGKRVAIIGAGPSGLSGAYFLALYGFDVEVFEKREKAGGMADATIPEFRLPDKELQDDIARIKKMGVKINFNHNIDKQKFEQLRKGDVFDYIYIAIGAWNARKLGFEDEFPGEVFDGIEFLKRVKSGEKLDIGKKIAIIGGGNSAIDAARLAKRMAGKDSEVTILYRRRIEDMPASDEEIMEASEDDIEIRHFISPETVEKGSKKRLCLNCALNEAGDIDKSGRPTPMKIEGSAFQMEFDTIITAIGQNVELDFIDDDDFEPNILNCESGIDNVFIGGDALLGPATIVKAVGTGRFVAERIARKEKIEIPKSPKADYGISKSEHVLMRSFRDANLMYDFQKTGLLPYYAPPESIEDAKAEAGRCLRCDDYCGICATVCPNRANWVIGYNPMNFKLPNSIEVQGNALNQFSGKVDIFPSELVVEQPYQVVNIGDFCNECGNCETFCPTSGAPYRDKPRFYLSKDAFEQASRGFIINKYNKMMVIRNRETGSKLTLKGGDFVYDSKLLNAVFTTEDSDNPFKLEDLILKAPVEKYANLTEALVLRTLLDLMVDYY